MADVETSCPVAGCSASFATKRGLAIHMTRSHGGYSTSMSSARAIPCAYPKCNSAFRSRRGLAIHQSMRGHQPPADTYTRGDGPEPVIRVRGKSKDAEMPDMNLDAQPEVEMAREDHPAMRPLRAAQIRPEPPEGEKLTDRILAVLRGGKTEPEADTMVAAGTATADDNPGRLAQAMDASLDAAIDAYDKKYVAQAAALVDAADVVSDELLEALGLPSDDDQDQGPSYPMMMADGSATDDTAVTVYAVTLWGLIDEIVAAFQSAPADARKMLDQTEDLCDKLLDALGVADPDNI